MTWSRKTKDLGVSAPATSHPAPSSRPHPSVGFTPTMTSVNLTPAALFGATARCTYLHTVNPTAVTAESLMIQALTEQHVDDVASDFFIQNSANSFKDFARSYFAGTVAAGLSYLFMIGEGYIWSDHFELNSPKGNSAVKAGPDFVFARAGAPDVALVEAKGTLRASTTGIDRIANAAYTRQIEPHLGFNVGAGIATHGLAVGAWMVPPTAPATTPAAKLYVHHTAAPPITSTNVGGGGDTDASLTSIVTGNYAICFDLVFGPNTGLPLRGGLLPVGMSFRRLEWLGEGWIVAAAGLEEERYSSRYLRDRGCRPIFALHYQTTREMADRLSRFGPDGLSDFEPAPRLRELSHFARVQGGAVFPDGLAVLPEPEFLGKFSQPSLISEWAP